MGAVSGLNMIATRLSAGAISESSSSHLPPNEGSKPPNPVMFPLGRSSRATMPLTTGSPVVPKNDRDRPRLPLRSNGRLGPIGQDDVGLQADQLLRERSYPIGVTAPPTKVHPHVAGAGPTQVRKRLRECRDAGLLQGIVFVAPHEQADAPHPLRLLPPRDKRPNRRAAEPSDEFA